MALKTLKDIRKIGGFELKRVDWNHPSMNFIEINDRHNAITFKLQNGPILEEGVNGCQIDTIIEAAICILIGLNHEFPCDENFEALTKLDQALKCLEKRRKNRVLRQVEGTSNK